MKIATTAVNEERSISVEERNLQREIFEALKLFNFFLLSNVHSGIRYLIP